MSKPNCGGKNGSGASNMEGAGSHLSTSEWAFRPHQSRFLLLYTHAVGGIDARGIFSPHTHTQSYMSFLCSHALRIHSGVRMGVPMHTAS